VQVEHRIAGGLDCRQHDGEYSGRQPAITAFTASFSTVARPKFGGTSPTSASRDRRVAASIASTRAREGGTTGSPSVTPRSNQTSRSSAGYFPRRGVGT
jgi:hypothetical protein